MKKILIILLLLAVDLITKRIAAHFLYPNGTFEIIEGFFRFAYLENRGAAFGFFANSRIFLLVIRTIIISALIYYMIFKIKDEQNKNIKEICIIFVISGALGNFIDSLLFGYVIDFLEFTFINFAIFNVADIFIVLGAVTFLISDFFKNNENKEKKENI